MAWLIACERSGIVRDEFLALGIEAYSCDLFPSRRPSPFHIECDVHWILQRKWTGVIAFPTCRYLTNAGVRWLHTEPERWELMEKGARFYNLFRNAEHIPFRGIENPIQHRYAIERTQHCAPEVQFLHPYHFGDPFQKATGLRTYGLPRLVPTHRKSDYAPGAIKHEVHYMGPDREEKRSETKPGFAKAFAVQWGLWAQYKMRYG